MRWTLRITAVLAVMWAAYFVWPYFAAYRLAEAVLARDVGTVKQRVNFSAVRQSLAEQIFTTYLRLTGREAKLGAFSGLAIAATSAIADPIVAQLVSSEALTDLLANGWPIAVLPERLPGIEGLRSGSIGTAWQVFAHSEHGLRSFSVMVPAQAAAGRRFRLQFRLSSRTWRLVGVELPEELKVRLTQELVRLLERK
jgi:hypothetical protein